MKLLGSDEPARMGLERVQEVNMACLRIAARMRELHHATRCERHPDGDPVLYIVASTEGDIIMDKSGLCCEELRKQIHVLSP